MKIELDDRATPFLIKTGKLVPKATAGGIKAAAFQLRQRIKEGMLAEAPGGQRWPSLHPWTKYKVFQKAAKKRFAALAKGRTVKPMTKFSIIGGKESALRRLAYAARYKFYQDTFESGAAQSKARIGFLTPSARRLAEYHAAGPHQVAVTAKMRRKIFAVGLGIRAAAIRIPQRAHVELVYRANEWRVVKFLRSRIYAAIAGQDPKQVEF